MRRKIFITIAAVCALASILCGCAARVVHCDRCGREIRVKESSAVTEDWLLYCSDCEKELGLDSIIPEG